SIPAEGSWSHSTAGVRRSRSSDRSLPVHTTPVTPVGSLVGVPPPRSIAWARREDGSATQILWSEMVLESSLTATPIVYSLSSIHWTLRCEARRTGGGEPAQ